MCFCLRLSRCLQNTDCKMNTDVQVREHYVNFSAESKKLNERWLNSLNAHPKDYTLVSNNLFIMSRKPPIIMILLLPGRISHTAPWKVIFVDISFIVWLCIWPKLWNYTWKGEMIQKCSVYWLKNQMWQLEYYLYRQHDQGLGLNNTSKVWRRDRRVTDYTFISIQQH